MKNFMKMLFIIGMMMTTAVSVAQSNSTESIIFIMDEEPHCLVRFDFISLADIIAQGDTIVNGYDEDYAITVISTKDDDIKTVIIQEYGEKLNIRMFTQSSYWVEYYENAVDGSYPGEIEDLIAMVLHIRHINDVDNE